MGEKTNIGYAVLDARIAELGADNVLMDVATRVSYGDNPLSIAKSYGVPYIVLKKWLEEHGADMVALAKRAHADMLVSNAIDEVGAASVEDVAVARLRSETYLKIAGKQDKATWGDGQQIGGGGGSITIVIGDVVKEEPKVIPKVIEGDVI